MLILIAHGSRHERWRSSVERVAAAAATAAGAGSAADGGLRVAYMDCTPPTLLDVATAAVASGERVLQVLPLFLAEEGHVERDVRPLVEEARRALPGGVRIELLEPVGQQPEFTEALARIAGRVGEP